MAGIYIHIPFCKQACFYCDFHFSTNLKARADFLVALHREIELQVNYLNQEPVKTIYFGGGTPSLLSAEETGSILSKIRQHFYVDKNAEVSLEANPDDITTDRLDGWAKSGINRLSIGIQSFQADTLKFFNRAHTATQAVDCVALARAAGFNHISIDLMYGIPGKTGSDVASDLAQARLLAPEHLSAYALTIEPQTVFGRWHQKKQLFPAAEEAVAEQFELVMNTLTDDGYLHYEISNFCRPNYIAQHNSNYWLGSRYLGLGPSAHSFNTRTRQHNVANNAAYIREVSGGRIPFTLETLTPAEKINETIYTGLRTMWGCPLEMAAAGVAFSLPTHRAKILDQLVSHGQAVLSQTHLHLTPAGKLLADLIAATLFTDEDEIGALQKSL